MSFNHILGVMMVAAAAASCGPAAGSSSYDQYRGTFERSCSPIDAAAVALELRPESGGATPLVSVYLWPAAGVVSDQRYQLGREGEGTGAIYLSGTEWIPATDGEIEFDDYSDMSLAAGLFWIELGSGEKIEGRFEASWRDVGPVYCG